MGSTHPKHKPKTRKTLSTGRPPTARPPPRTLSARQTRSQIRSHHTLHRSLATAESRHDETLATSLRARIAAQGGLEAYQRASIQGQAAERGGDSSRVLVDWLSARGGAGGLRLLEVGALATGNACSTSDVFGGGVERIDLNSQAPGIKEQDFMARPLPRGEAERFEIVSLSLVVNFVPEAKGRGEMLRRVGEFLSLKGREGVGGLWPALFLVLPRPCVDNSRYLDEERLEEIMAVLGYERVRRKVSAKLVYYLWRFKGVPAAEGEDVDFGKKEIRSGRERNNFCIVLKGA